MKRNRTRGRKERAARMQATEPSAKKPADLTHTGEMRLVLNRLLHTEATVKDLAKKYLHDR